MTIKYKNFILKPGVYAKDRFDLIRVKSLVMGNSPKMREKYGNKPIGTIVGEKNEELGYDMNLESALLKLISILLSEDESTVDIKSYLQEYRKCKDEILNLLK